MSTYRFSIFPLGGFFLFAEIAMTEGKERTQDTQSSTARHLWSTKEWYQYHSQLILIRTLICLSVLMYITEYLIDYCGNVSFSQCHVWPLSPMLHWYLSCLEFSPFINKVDTSVRPYGPHQTQAPFVSLLLTPNTSTRWIVQSRISWISVFCISNSMRNDKIICRNWKKKSSTWQSHLYYCGWCRIHLISPLRPARYLKRSGSLQENSLMLMRPVYSIASVCVMVASPIQSNSF